MVDLSVVVAPVNCLTFVSRAFHFVRNLRSQ